MPSTRRTTHSANPAGTGKQSTLSFHNRVTKSTTPSRDAKKSILASTPTKQSPLARHVETIIPDEEVTSEAEELKSPVAPEKSEAQIRAERVSDHMIAKYWRGLETERKAKRVHQEQLSTGEKVLRYFDVSSQYGPCVGLPRMKRWERAERLGLEPPIEALAVLLREEAGRTERAYVDQLLNPAAVGSV